MERTFEVEQAIDFLWCGPQTLILRSHQKNYVLDLRNGKRTELGLGQHSLSLGCTKSGEWLYSYAKNVLAFYSVKRVPPHVASTQLGQIAVEFHGNPVSPSGNHVLDQSRRLKEAVVIGNRSVGVVPVDLQSTGLEKGKTNFRVNWNDSESIAILTTTVVRPWSVRNTAGIRQGVAIQDIKTGATQFNALTLNGGVVDGAAVMGENRLLVLLSSGQSSDFAVHGNVHEYNLKSKLLNSQPLWKNVDSFDATKEGGVVLVRSSGIDGYAQDASFTHNAASLIYEVRPDRGERLIRSVDANYKYVSAGPQFSMSGEAFAVLRRGPHNSVLHVYTKRKPASK